MTNSPVFCALDTADTEHAMELARKLKGNIAGLKIGLEYFMANGPLSFRSFAELGMPIFLDVKLHDIPNTVKGAITSLLPLEPDFITIHTSGGPAMMKAAAQAAAQAKGKRPKLLGVTVLTSLDSDDLAKVGQDTDSTAQAKRLALLAKESGLDGIICSPAEAKTLREACGPDFILMVPGIRPSWAATGDQKRITTPKDAIEAGATYLVIGRPITGAEDPVEAAQKIAEELEG
ncbi:MAG: orotidine-5'-phosphate decarboxylase [Bdellovibrionales bacterium]